MTKVIPFPTKPKMDEADANVQQFGGCPYCGRLDYFFNVGRDHWCTCETHKTKWHIGENIFSSWRNETDADWTRNSYRLCNYRKVDSILPDKGGAP